MADTREAIMTAARATAQAHGYTGLSFRELAKTVGVKSASIHYYFPTKGDLGAALARQYREDARVELAGIMASTPDAAGRLRAYFAVFRRALENGNRMCMCGLMAAERDDLPAEVQAEVAAFADCNVAWLAEVLAAGDLSSNAEKHLRRAAAVYAAIGGAQLSARAQGDVEVYDAVTEEYLSSGLIPS